ncbi:MAG: hypothetical protein ACU0A6_14085, partial [Shimia sp.]|uniref:hypothetical protein n=1 Tax=Shimia sp. TaxID=1954381 RepID=UPI0040594454
TPLSAWFKIPMIWASLYFDCFIRIYSFIVEKILPINASNFRGDYHDNRSFALLAQSELNGSLSISDRDNYLKSDLRVIVYDDRELSEFPYREEVSYEKMPTWVRECEQLGVVGQNYCEGYAVIPVMPVPEPRSAILRVINSTPSKEVQVEEFYDRLVASGEIDKFNDMILESVLGRNKLLQQAEAEVARMPTSAFVDPNDELYDRQVKGAILKRHHELLCKR